MIQNPALYKKAKDIADATYKKPSAYKSGFLIKTYKKLGGTYQEDNQPKELKRWYKERWTDVGGKDYPVFRPTIRISKDTPLTVQEIDPQNLKKQIALKQRYRGVKNLPRFAHKNSPYPIMPKHGKGKHGMGFLDDLKSFGLSAAKDVGRELIPVAKDFAINAAKDYLTKKPATPAGKGLYAKGTGYTLSAAQGRALAVGKGVTLKPSMMGGDYEMEMTPAMEKKMARAFASGKGMRVGAHNLISVKKGGFIIPLLRTAAMIAAPIVMEKLADAGIKKLGGAMDTPKQAKRRAALKDVMGDGLFKNTLLQKSMGMGLYAGGGIDGVSSEVIQTGSPYQYTQSPAMSPYVPTRNPFGSYVPI
jgi:hypothetical protein